MTNVQPHHLCAAVRAFMVAAGQPVDQPDPRTVALYTGLQLEELAEKLQALGLSGAASQLAHLGDEFKGGMWDNDVADALDAAPASLLDADIDIAWVSVGAAYAAGADVSGAIATVAMANLSKVWPDGWLHLDNNGKVMKPPHFIAPDLLPFVHASLGGRP